MTDEEIEEIEGEFRSLYLVYNSSGCFWNVYASYNHSLRPDQCPFHAVGDTLHDALRKIYEMRNKK